jgi:hypothetical protein
MEDLKDPEQAELEHKMMTTINSMDSAVQDRFKALKVVYDAINQAQDEEEQAQRLIEVKYEKLYQKVY